MARRRGRSFRAGLLAAAYIISLGLGFSAFAGALRPEVAAAAPASITDCTGGNPSNTDSLAYAVAHGGTYTLDCGPSATVSTTLVVPDGVTVALDVPSPLTLNQTASSQFFQVDSTGTLTIDGSGNLTLSGVPPAPARPVIVNDGTVTIDGTTVTGVTAGPATAPIENDSGATMTISDSTLTNNQGGEGGAVYNDGRLSVEGSVFSGNAADLVALGALDAGGAILNDADGTLTVTDSTFQDNAATANVTLAPEYAPTGSGGAIFNGGTSSDTFGGTATISDSTFSGNSASGSSYTSYDSEGGAIFNNDGVLRVSNSTIAGNTAYQRGGGLYTTGYGPTAAIYSSTFSGNASTLGVDGRMYAGDNIAFLYAAPYMANDIVSDPSLPASPPPGEASCNNQLLPGPGNLEWGDTSCGSPSPPDWTLGNPELQPLALNPGPNAPLTQTMALGPGSAAIGLADSSYCQGTTLSPVDGADQRGVTRPAGHCDSGAYQSLGLTVGVSPSPVTIQGGAFDQATVGGTVYTGVYAPGLFGVGSMPVTLSVPGGDGALSATGATSKSDGTYGGITYTAPASVSDPSHQGYEAVTVTASTYSPYSAGATVDVLSPPDLTALSQPSGQVGTPLTLSGYNFVNNQPGTPGTVYFLNAPVTAPTPTVEGVEASVPLTTGSESDTGASVAVPGLGPGTVYVAVWNPTQGLLSNTQPFTVEAPPPPPTTGLQVTADPPFVTVAGGARDTSRVSGAVYLGGEPLVGAQVTLSVPAGSGTLDGGSSTTETAGSAGEFRATYASPPVVPGTDPVTVTATVYGGTYPSATTTIDVLPPPELTQVAPGSQFLGLPITLTGQNFESPGTTSGAVYFTPSLGSSAARAAASETGAIVVTPQTETDTSATLTVPATLTEGATYEVAVWNPAQGLLSNTQPFTVTVPGGGGGGGAPPPTSNPVSQPVPSGACGTITLPSGSTLSASAGSAGTPVGIAPDSKAASCEFKLSGPQQSGPQPVTLQYSSDVLGGLPATRVSVFRLRGDGSWTFLPSLVDAKAGTVTASVSGPETLVALADLQAFPDVPSGYWAKDAIDVAAGAELVDGFPPPFDGLYQPGGPITRAQAAKMVVVDAQLLPQSGPTPFTDVHASDWYAPYIAAGYQAGILDGLTPTTFGPDQPVTREQFAVMLARALKLSGTATLTYADAAAIDGWARAGVEAVVAAGYFDGMPGNMFQPHAVLTRAQAAQAMARVVQRQAPSGQP